jgi:hypothetical protein
VKNSHRAVFGVLALSAACFSTALAAPAAHAGSENYIQITHKAAFVANTCYNWREAENKNYCHNARSAGDSWKAYFPADATGVIIDLSLWPAYSAKASAPVTDTNRNHCYEVSGTLLNPTLLETGC